jgi:glucose/arabinose dehydrogenase
MVASGRSAKNRQRLAGMPYSVGTSDLLHAAWREPVLRRPRVVVLMASLMSLTVLFPTPALAAAPTLTARVVQGGLEIPWDVAFAPGGQMFVTEREGRVRVFASGRPGAARLATTPLSNVRAEGEAGVMGIAVDHLFSSNRLVYICVSRSLSGHWKNQLIRYHVTSAWKLQIDRVLIRDGMRANTIHNGCAVEEGPDHKIWLTMGDAGNSSLAQDPDRLNGKVLRVNRDGSIPNDNPTWPGDSGPTRVYSMGHRNPQGITFQPGTNRVYAIEHGPDVNDEINWIRPGRNYGWPCRTGMNHVNESCPGGITFTNPVWSSEGPTLATSNGAFVHGAVWESFAGNLFVATLKEQDLRRFSFGTSASPATLRATLFNNKWGRLRATVQGPGGSLWITTSNGSNDRVIRITPS